MQVPPALFEAATEAHNEGEAMKIETPYGDVEPQIDWGYCPKCDAVNLEWYEDGPICPSCGHLWDSSGADVGSWEENMGSEWETSSTRRGFKTEAERRIEWWDELRGRLAGARESGAKVAN